MAQSTTTGSPHERPIGSNSSALCLTRQSPQLPNDQVKFATYTRDSATGNDYADQRYYTSVLGRFMTPDPHSGSATPNNPTSWNRYGYVNGDPANSSDPSGLCVIGGVEYPDPCFSVTTTDFTGGVGAGGGHAGPNPNTIQQYDDVHPNSSEQQWNELGADCQQALETAMPKSSIASMLKAVDRAEAAKSTLMAAAAGTSIDWTMLAAIAIRETGFNDILQICKPGISWGDPKCSGAGYFQIDLSKNPAVSETDALDLSFAASWAANLLNGNMSKLAAKYPNLSYPKLLQATAASYNFGTKNISGNPNTIDQGSTGNNYGSNVLGLMSCFQ